ncbi:hypothetical protein H5410_059082 [Solanum commersonii]|uniref:Uncharacterized protein n=1 Tax=Solanum commersonii TaxID=4109 RepID=A0A9J5W1V9_SOLCO|nr:hypothetical protein H5410_059082 [Solanum commersonii]
MAIEDASTGGSTGRATGNAINGSSVTLDHNHPLYSTGYVKENCYLLIGYPDNFKGKKKVNAVIGGGSMQQQETHPHMQIQLMLETLQGCNPQSSVNMAGSGQDKDQDVSLSYSRMEDCELTHCVVFRNTVDAPATVPHQAVVTDSSCHDSAIESSDQISFNKQTKTLI